MDRFPSVADFLAVTRPERPVLALRPHAAARAARWFLDHFPGDVVYALKANDAPLLLEALLEAGIRHFDTASLAEIETLTALTGPGARHVVAHVMNPVKSRATIRRAYFEHGVRTFALDSLEELAKIRAETEGARDLTLLVRIACSGAMSRIPLDGKYGAAGDEAARLLLETRRLARTLGITFHVGSQAMQPAAFADAMAEAGRLIAQAGVMVDVIDVGGGFPSRYPGMEPPPLAAFLDAIREARAALPVGEACRLVSEPGRALVAEAESVLVRVDARRGDALYVNDGAFGALFDCAHSGFVYPARLIRPGGAGKGDGAPSASLRPFRLWGPTCDSIDHMPGPFHLPQDVREGDYIEIGHVGAYGRVMASRFNGFSVYDEIVVTDAPMLSMYPAAPGEQAARGPA